MDVVLLFAIDGILVLLHRHARLPADSIHIVSFHFISLQIDFATLDLDDAVHSLNFFFLAFTKPSDCTQREPPLPIVSMSHFQTVVVLFIPSETEVLPSSVISHFSSSTLLSACTNHQSMATNPTPQTLLVILPADRPASSRRKNAYWASAGRLEFVWFLITIKIVSLKVLSTITAPQRVT
jgi:hypothetical protein